MDIELIRNIFISKKEKVGALQIKMIMENDYSSIMNHKKIRRLMAKYNLLAKIRRANRKLKQAVCHEFHPSAILHSDQGFHFTHLLFQRKVKELGITKSMSRKGNLVN
ncbi:IS3 family transposase [Peribacillus butanolivorans]|uniref:IS3 family transposase n=1 Tax=Peribacillus butanolivorans TaxID=421767 RepID=UPI0035D87107